MNKLRCLLAVFVSALVMMTCLSFTPHARAQESALGFDAANVLDDLRSSTVNGKPFNILNYPFDGTGLIKHPEIINVVEYCYSFKVNMQGNFGLYLYVYNPQNLDIDVTSRQNKVQLAVSYDRDGTPDDYEKFDLKFCSRSDDPNYRNLFYKFRIVDRKSADGKTILTRVNSNERRYDISGVELLTRGAANATDYLVGGTYKFTGYAAGYGSDPDAASNLLSTVNELETVQLQIQNTLFRSGVSDLGAGHQTDLNSVYFSVDNTLVTKYGKLQKIKAEWYEYKTDLAVVSKDKALSDALLPFLGQDIGEHTDSLDYKLWYDLIEGGNDLGGRWSTYGWSYNIASQKGDLLHHAINLKNPCFKLFYSLYTSSSDMVVSPAAVKDYIFGYDKSFINGTLPVKDGSISADLFLDGGKRVDDGRKADYNSKELDNDNLFDWFHMPSYDSNHDSWQKFWDFGFNPPATDESFQNIRPILQLDDALLTGSNTDISKAILVNPLDLDDSGTKGSADYTQGLKSFYADAKKQSKTTYLFRFATTDYFAEALSYKGSNNTTVKNKAYLSQQTVFLDFDILTLTFNRDGVYRVIPAVSSPIDIINGLTPPLTGSDKLPWWLILIIGLLLLLIIAVVCAPILPHIVTFACKVIALPFKVLGVVFKGIGKAVHNAKEKKN